MLSFIALVSRKQKELIIACTPEAVILAQKQDVQAISCLINSSSRRDIADGHDLNKF